MIWIVLLYVPAWLVLTMVRFLAFLLLPPPAYDWIWDRCSFACEWGYHADDSTEDEGGWYAWRKCRRCGDQRHVCLGMP
jgi:hypothetical protein